MSDSSKKPDKLAPTPTPPPPKPDPNLYSVEQRARKPAPKKRSGPKPDPRLKSIIGRYEVLGADRRLKSVQTKVTVAAKPVRRTEKGRKSSK